jgi:predicted RNA-binding Zn-ribbon protein involved in translation (DUF1610 family)
VKGAFMSTVISEAFTSKIHSLQELSEEYGLQLECAIQPDLAIEADPELAMLLIEGLINTAFKYGCKGDTVAVTGRSNGRVTVDVLLTCAESASRRELLDGKFLIVEPLLSMMKAELAIAFPTDKSILYTLLLSKVPPPKASITALKYTNYFCPRCDEKIMFLTAIESGGSDCYYCENCLWEQPLPWVPASN